MATPTTLSPPKALLLAAHLAATQDLPRLHHLITLHPSVLTGPALLRVLLHLPETAAPASYIPFIEHAHTAVPLPPLPDAPPPLDVAPVAKISEKRARALVELRLPPLQDDASPLESFLTARAYAIDAETGVLSIVHELLAPYTHLLPGLVANVDVLQRLVYEYARSPTPALQEFCQLPVDEALEVLIIDAGTVVRDLATLVEPYMATRDKGEWRQVWTRLGVLPFVNIVEVVARWTPPAEVRAEFAGWAVGVCYRCEDTSGRAWELMHSVHRRIASIPGATVDDAGAPVDKVGDLDDPLNPLFRPTTTRLQELDVLITSAAILARPLKEVVRLKLEGTKELQHAVLGAFVQAGEWQKRDDDEWRRTRDGARWMHQKARVLARLPVEDVELTVLSALLTAARFPLARALYLPPATPVLSIPAIETAVLTAFNAFFAAASNGNRTRGSMKSAYAAVTLLYPTHSTSPALESAYRLIAAVHALSSYSLTLTPGVPLLPARIRSHPDPTSLLDRVLSQNRRAYLQPDTLVSIAADLAPAHAAAAEPRVLAMAAAAALAESDFETAYAYTTTRLLPSATPPAAVAAAHPRLHAPAAPDAAAAAAARDHTWRTALATGRWRPPTSAPLTLGMLEKKLDLLALAVRFAPAEALVEVLAVWRRCEEELEAAVAAEERAEREHRERAERMGMAGSVTGGRGMAAARRGGEAPQSLFEVARGAARVGMTGMGMGMGMGSRGGARGEGEGEGEGERVRKRDMVGGMVTQGLASGLGWVLGAQPVEPK
ncbi:Sec39 domain-containing protein [Geopyxis carbonaria]|nr:Sec39 domain-containing protein [Geopyxis carbonaria]